MATFRLYNVDNGQLEHFPLDDCPAYLAASHTWSENAFPKDCPFKDCFGGQGLLSVIRERHPRIRHCWFDTLCIDQQDEQHKREQIPLMDRIFGNAECVVVLISATIDANQVQVDWLMSEIDGALAMCLAEAWKEEGAYWQTPEGRKWLYLAKKGLLRLASTAWATRIWTLQEYVLANAILWIGKDLRPIEVDDYALSALPDICNTLGIEECLTPEFRVLDAYFAGMSNARLKTIDRTRIMELPGNRNATVPVDEVYGVMAASGVIIQPQPNESRPEAWTRWCEEALRQGHLRWMLLPASSGQPLEKERQTCIFPYFMQRHELSGCSGLDSIVPFRSVSVGNGIVTTQARNIGSARIVRRFGPLHEPEPGTIYREITLILFAESKWSLALKIVWTFSGGRYNVRQSRAIAQVLVQSYARAVRCVAHKLERTFKPMLSSHLQEQAWTDFVKLQQSRMLGVNVGAAYLCKMRLKSPIDLEVLTVVVLGRDPPRCVTATELARCPKIGTSMPWTTIRRTEHLRAASAALLGLNTYADHCACRQKLQALDFEANGPDGRPVLMLVHPATLENGMQTLHKVGMTLGVSDDAAQLWKPLPLEDVSIGGFGCSGCNNSSSDGGTITNNLGGIAKHISKVKCLRRLRMVERQQERSRFKLFSAETALRGRRPSSQYRCSRLQMRGLRAGLRKTHEVFRDVLGDG